MDLLTLRMPVDVLKGKLINLGKSCDLVTLIPGIYRTDKSALHGYIFIDDNYQYRFFDYSNNAVITNVFESNFKDIENKEVVDNIFTAFRKLDVRKYIITLLDTEDEKALYVCDKYKFSFVNTVELDSEDHKEKRTLIAIDINEPNEVTDTDPSSIDLSAILLLKDLTPESLEKYIASRLAEV